MRSRVVSSSLFVCLLAAAVTLAPSAVTVRAQAASPQVQAGAADPRVVSLIDQVSAERIEAILRRLQSFGTRNTLSSADKPDMGVGAARQWILDEMKASSARLQVSFDSHQVPKGGRITRDIELRNVMAVLPGRSPRRVYIMGHYDSLSLQRAVQRPAQGTTGQPGQPARAGAQGAVAQPGAPQAAPTPDAPLDHPAPGVNDDGSGTATVMELARVFAASGLEFDATLVFIAVVAEEQGLVGARMHAQKAAEQKIPIDAVLNNDMIGNAEGGLGVSDSASVRVFSEGPEDSASRQLARYIGRHAAHYVPSHEIRLIARYDRFGRGGDHTPFNQAGFAAVRITESKENYGRQHTPADTIDHVSMPYLVKNVRVNGAVAASLALAPPAPIVTEKGRPAISRGASGYDADLRWQASPGAVGYSIFWREAWTPDWQHEMTVGAVTQALLPGLSIDDYVFGVAAIGAEGHESLVSAYVNPPRQ